MSRKKVTLSLTKDAIDALERLTTERKRGELVSSLIVAQAAALDAVAEPGSTAPAAIAGQLRRLADAVEMLEDG